jgi:hypothetical protein
MKKFLMALMVFITAILIAAMGLRSYVIHKVQSQLSPEQSAHLEEMKTKVLQIDPKELEPRPFESATVEAAKTVQEEWKASEKDALKLLSDFDALTRVKPGEQPPPESRRRELLDQASRFDNLTSAYARLVRMPDYEIDVMAAAADSGPALGMAVPNFLICQSCVKLLRLKSLAAAEQGRMEEAMAIAETMASASRSPKYSTLIAHLIGIAELNIATRTWHTVVDKCDDTAILWSTLQKQNAFGLQAALIPPDMPVTALDSLGGIRVARRAGIDSNPVGMTGEQLSGERFRVEAEYLERVALPKAKNQETEELIRKQVKGYRAAAAASGSTPQGLAGWGAWLARPVVAPMLQSMAMPNFTEASVRSDAARAQFELLRIATAMKLYRLETGGDVKSLQDLVPKYLPAAPVDVFAEGGKPCSVAPEPHSIGPDKKDQEAALVYDPTNGTLSAGDIVLRPIGR